MIASTFTSKDQNWQDGTTTYWFVLNGDKFDNETFGIVVSDTDSDVVDYCGYPLQNDHIKNTVLRHCDVTTQEEI